MQVITRSGAAAGCSARAAARPGDHLPQVPGKGAATSLSECRRARSRLAALPQRRCHRRSPVQRARSPPAYVPSRSACGRLPHLVVAAHGNGGGDRRRARRRLPFVRGGTPRILVFAARATQFVLLGVLFWYHRGSRLLPTTAAERELWTIWDGYLFAYAVIILVGRMFASSLIRPANRAGSRHAHLSVLRHCQRPVFFSSWEATTGAAVTPSAWCSSPYRPTHDACLDLAPLVFGFAWSGSLVFVGQHLRRLGEEGRCRMPRPAPHGRRQSPTTVASRRAT